MSKKEETNPVTPDAKNQKPGEEQRTEQGRNEQTPDITGQQKKGEQGMGSDEQKKENPSQQKQQEEHEPHKKYVPNPPTSPGSGV